MELDAIAGTNDVTPAFQPASFAAFLPRLATGGGTASQLADRNVSATALAKPPGWIWLWGGLVTLFFSTLTGFGREFLWAKQAGGDGLDSARSIAVDADGNAFVTGSFQNAAAFGTTNLTSQGGHDAFVAKYDASGNLTWVKQAGGLDNDFGWAIAVDDAGNCYAAGTFISKATLDSATLNGRGSQDLFLVKYDRSGNLLWARSEGGIGAEQCQALAIDRRGNLYLTGFFSGASVLGNVSLTSAGASDVFVAKLDPDGKVLWAQRGGGKESDLGVGIAADDSGNCYVTGSFQASASFASLDLISAGSSDLFITKYDSTGRVLWSKTAGGAGDDQGRALAIDKTGNVFVSGSFQATLNFSGLKIDSQGGDQALVAKLDQNGTPEWVKSVAGDRSFGFGISLDAASSAYLTGHFLGRASLDEITLAAKDWDLFVAKLSSSGEFLWANQADSAGFEVGYAIAANPMGESYVTGVFASTNVLFGCATLRSPKARDDIFVAKLAAKPLISAQPQNQTVIAGHDVTFKVEAASSGAPLRYQWFVEEKPIEGATSAAFTLANAQSANAGNYKVVIGFGDCSVSSAMATLTVRGPPFFTVSPQNQVVEIGASATFRAEAGGTGPFSYQWWFNETNRISGATNSTLALPQVTTNQAGVYVLSVSNSVGTTRSQPASLQVAEKGAPIIRVNGQAGTSFAIADGDLAVVQIQSSFAKATIFYTLDGSAPDPSSTLYTAPFTLTRSAVVRAVAYDSTLASAQSAPLPVNYFRTVLLTASTAGGGKILIEPPGGVYREGAIATATAQAAAGWRFLRWTGDATGSDARLSVLMDRPKRVQAVFGTTVQSSVRGAGSIRFNPALAVYEYGSSVQALAFPEAGNYFGLWGGAAFGNTNPFTLNLTNAAPEISALFAELSPGRFALTAVPNGAGQVSMNPRGNVFTNGQPVTLTAVPDGTNQFLFWSGDAKGTVNPLALVVDTSKIITANFTGGREVYFQSVTRTAGGSFQASLSSEPGRVFLIETSTNLLEWSLWETLTNESGTVLIREAPVDPIRYRFFRARSR